MQPDDQDAQRRRYVRSYYEREAKQLKDSETFTGQVIYPTLVLLVLAAGALGIIAAVLSLIALAKQALIG